MHFYDNVYHFILSFPKKWLIYIDTESQIKHAAWIVEMQTMLIFPTDSTDP